MRIKIGYRKGVGIRRLSSRRELYALDSGIVARKSLHIGRVGSHGIRIQQYYRWDRHRGEKRAVPGLEVIRCSPEDIKNSLSDILAKTGSSRRQSGCHEDATSCRYRDPKVELVGGDSAHRGDKGEGGCAA